MEDLGARVELDPDPRSAAIARSWTRGVLDRIGRPDLTESAAVSVSELVTNGILHAGTSISLVVQAFGDRVVVTVTDRCPVPSPARISAAAQRDGDRTVGRGLGIVRAHARDWGIVSSPHGKSIWFVPSEHPHAVDLDAFPEIDLMGDEESSEPRVGGPIVTVEMVDAPLEVMRHYQERWTELVRELQLIALGESSPLQALARQLAALLPLTRAARWMSPEALAAVTAAMAAGADRASVRLDVEAGARDAVVRTLELLRELEDTAHRERLLYLSDSEQLIELREWWLGEMVSQLDGKAPRPWPGAFVVEE